MYERVDVVVPVKELHRAKSRLVAATDAALGPASPPDARRRAHHALALALAADTLAAVLRAERVGSVVVVSSEPRVRALGLGARVTVIDDAGGGLNDAVRLGAGRLRSVGARAVAALQADLPALCPEELDDALAAALDTVHRAAPAAFVADHEGSGTTMLVTAPGADPAPRFGPDSATAHARGGAAALGGAWPGLRADVDTPADLDRVLALGAGPATRAWAEKLLRPPLVPARCAR